MDNMNKYNAAFKEAFDITDSDLKDLTYQSIEAWDSVGHMTLISLLEDEFDIMFETDDIIDLSSYEKGIEILKEKYNIEF